MLWCTMLPRGREIANVNVREMECSSRELVQEEQLQCLPQWSSWVLHTGVVAAVRYSYAYWSTCGGVRRHCAHYSPSHRWSSTSLHVLDTWPSFGSRVWTRWWRFVCSQLNIQHAALPLSLQVLALTRRPYWYAHGGLWEQSNLISVSNSSRYGCNLDDKG